MTPLVHSGSKTSKEADVCHTTVLNFGVVQDCHDITIPGPLIMLDRCIQQLDTETLYNQARIFPVITGVLLYKPHLEEVAPRFEGIQGRHTGRQQTLAFRYRCHSQPELSYRGECPTFRSLPVFELEESARSVVQFEGVLPEAAPCVAYAPVDLDGQVGLWLTLPPRYTNSFDWLYSWPAALR